MLELTAEYSIDEAFLHCFTILIYATDTTIAKKQQKTTNNNNNNNDDDNCYFQHVFK